MIDVRKHDQALKLTWMDRIVQKPMLDVYCRRTIGMDTLTETGGYIDPKTIAKMKNVFWKEVLEAWNVFIIKNYPGIMPTNVLDQPLWNNPLFKDKSFYLSDWYQSGIKCFGDVLQTDGKVKSFEDLKGEFNLSGHFLQYIKLVCIIPADWKKSQREKDRYTMTTPCTPPIRKFLQETKIKAASRYYKSLCQSLTEPTSQKTWHRKLYVDVLPWEKLYMIPFKTTPEVKLRNFQYRILHRILPVNEALFKMKIIQSNLCTFCKSEVETLEHLFVECEFSKQLWIQISSLLRNKTKRDVNLSKVEKLFGSLEENHMINHVILLVKKHIYFKRVTNSLPNFEDFKMYLHDIIKMEKYISRLKDSEDEMTRKWVGFLET